MNDPFDNPDVQHLNLYLYLIPVFGFFPAIWTLSRRKASRQQLQASRLSVTLAMVWLLSYILLETGAKSSEFLSLPLLIVSSVVSSSYFIICLTLMFRLGKRQSLWLPWVSQISDRLP